MFVQDGVGHGEADEVKEVEVLEYFEEEVSGYIIEVGEVMDNSGTVDIQLI